MTVSTGLQIDSVSFSYAVDPVLESIHLAIPQGQFVCLVGASGSGKSTLLRLIAGLQPPTTGRLAWNGQAIAGPGLERGIVFQDYSLFPWMSVVDNIEIAIAKAKPEQPRHERREEAHDCLRHVGLESAIGKYPFELSGGMRQRAAIARALALGSPLLLLDEPFGALDPINRARLQDVLLEIWETSVPRKTIVFVTHDVDEALYLGNRLIILGATPGRVIADLQLEFSRTQDRRDLFESPSFQIKREKVAEILAEDTLRLLLPA